MKQYLNMLLEGQQLSREDTHTIMVNMTKEAYNEHQIAALLMGIQMRGATVDELLGFRDGLLETGKHINLDDYNTLDIVGTGGDHAHSFNISTTSALVAAAGGMKVAKHGNRAASSKCGTADCLEALGVNIDLAPEKCRQLLEEVGICFLFAQKYHTSMKYVGPIRRELGIRTVFNILGPLTNPASPKVQLLGVYDEYLTDQIGRAHV